MLYFNFPYWYLIFKITSLINLNLCKVTHYQFSSVTQSCPTLWDPMDCSTPGFPAQHLVLELGQTHIHRVSDAFQSSHPLSSPSSPVFNLSSIRVFSKSQFLASGGWSSVASASASVLLMNIQHWFPLGLTDLISLQSKGHSGVFFSNTRVQKHQFFGTQIFLWSNSHIHTWLLEKPYLWLDGPLLTK